MSSAATTEPRDLAAEMTRFTGRHVDKRFDWEAFPASDGYPDLDRAQMRYVGAGGSPKVDDPGTLKAEHFTVSIVTQPPGKYAASHRHECEESFLCLGGTLTVGWSFGDEVLETRLNAKDMCLNQLGRPHGFRNDSEAPILASIMVGSARPRPPQYVYHPRDTDAVIARGLGAEPGKIHQLDPRSDDPRHREFSRHIVRYSQQIPHWNEAGFGRLVYIGEGGAPAGNYRKDLIHLPRGNGVRPYSRDVEDVFFVLDGVVTVAWEENGHPVEQRLGPKDLIFNPPGRLHSFRNDGLTDAQFMMVVGTPSPEDIIFKAA